MVMRWAVSMVLMTAGLGGCLDQGVPATPGSQATNPDPPDSNDPADPDPTDPADPDPDPTDPSDPDPTDPADPDPSDPADPDPTDPADPDPSDPADPDPPDSNDPAAPHAAWCVPQAARWEPSLVFPEVPAEAYDDVCALESESIWFSYNDTHNEVRYTWEGQSLWVEWAAASPRNLLQLRFDAAGNRVEAKYGTRRNDQRAFGTWNDTFVLRWDAAGNLVESATERGGIEHLEMRQRFEDGRLVERLELRNRWDAAKNEIVAVTLATGWSYDGAGRLSAIEAEGWDRKWTVAWSHDADGRPTSVERRLDGALVERLTWRYATDGALAARTVMRDPEPLREDGFDPALLDSYGARHTRADLWSGDPWFDSVPEVADSGCTWLPTSSVHGYPSAEAEYDLGMPRDERPSGIGFAYGANTYGWNYGDLAWYSHAGVHGFDSVFDYGMSFSSEQRYAGGRLVEETFTSTVGPILSGTRKVTFADGNVAVDRLDLVVADDGVDGEAGGAPLTYGRELRFTWDIKGTPSAARPRPRLIQRELHDDALGLVEWQSWSRDDAGRWLSHTIHAAHGWGSRAAISLFGWDATTPCDACDDTPKLRMFYSRTVDEHGRTLERRTSQPDAAGVLQQSRLETWSYDAAGRVVAEQHDGGYLLRYAYDEAGRLVYESWDYDGLGDTPDGWETTVYDELGRWVERESWSGGAVHHRALRGFACDP